VGAVGRDDDFAVQDEVGVLAGLALRHQRFAGFERVPTGRRDQAREVFLGEIAERADRSHRGAQLRSFGHFPGRAPLAPIAPNSSATTLRPLSRR
jgi:hypothetical protein